MKRVGNEYKAWIDEFIRMSQLTYVPNSERSSSPVSSVPLLPYIPAPAGFDEDERYQYWMGKPFPKGQWVKAANRQMTIILEPDALGLMGARRSCIKRSQVASRLALLAYAAQRLGTTPGMNVYIDAGSSTWVKRGKIANYLRRAGVQYTRGFALNSTHFNRTSKELPLRRRARALPRQALRDQHRGERQRLAAQAQVGQVRLGRDHVQSPQRRLGHTADDQDRIPLRRRIPLDLAPRPLLQR